MRACYIYTHVHIRGNAARTHVHIRGNAARERQCRCTRGIAAIHARSARPQYTLYCSHFSGSARRRPFFPIELMAEWSAAEVEEWLAPAKLVNFWERLVVEYVKEKHQKSFKAWLKHACLAKGQHSLTYPLLYSRSTHHVQTDGVWTKNGLQLQ